VCVDHRLLPYLTSGHEKQLGVQHSNRDGARLLSASKPAALAACLESRAHRCCPDVCQQTESLHEQAPSSLDKPTAQACSPLSPLVRPPLVRRSTGTPLHAAAGPRTARRVRHAGRAGRARRRCTAQRWPRWPRPLCPALGCCACPATAAACSARSRRAAPCWSAVRTHSRTLLPRHAPLPV